MLRIYCDTCKGQVSLNEDQTQAVCGSCGRVLPVPRGYSVLESRFCFAAEAEGRHDYETAVETYNEIIAAHPENAHAYWKRAGARYGIEYRPAGEGVYRLVCHRAEEKAFSEDGDVKKALSLAQGQEREAYLEETRRITALQTAVVKRHALGGRIDVILVGGGSAGASVRQIRAMLSAAGLQVFCPQEEFLRLPGEDWEPELYHAFSQASAFVATAEKAEDFTPQLLFDAARFLALQAEKQRSGKNFGKLFLAYGELDEYSDIPDEIFEGAEQRFSLAARDFASVLTDAVKEAVGDRQALLREEAGGHEDYAYRNLLRQAIMERNNGDFEAAAADYDEILNYNPREGQAYWGLLLCGKGCRNEEELVARGIDPREDVHWKSALAFATEREQQTYRKTAEDAAAEAAAREERRKEEERAAEAESALRLQKQKEIEEEKQKSILRAEKRKKKRLIVTALLLTGVAAGALMGYRYYQSEYGPESSYGRYNAAMELFQNGKYKEAKEAFAELGEYKDSAVRVEESEMQINALAYAEVLSHEGHLSTRYSDVFTLRSVQEEIPEAQSLLDRYREEGIAAYYEGRYQAAWEMLRGFGREDACVEEYILAWQILCNRGLFMRTDLNTCIIDRSGQIHLYGCDAFSVIDDGSVLYCSSALSHSGKSLALADTQGHVYLYGELEGKELPWGEERIVNLRSTDEEVMALTADGRLFDSRAGGAPVAENVRVFDLVTRENYPMINGRRMDSYEMNKRGYSVKIQDIVLAVRQDGSLYCSEERYAQALEEAGWYEKVWQCATAGQARIQAIDAEGTVWTYDFESGETLTREGRFAIAESGSAYKVDTVNLYMPAHSSGYSAKFTANSVESVEIDTQMPKGEEAGNYLRWLRAVEPPGLIEIP